MAYNYGSRSSTNTSAGVGMLILTAGTLYAHRASLFRIEAYATAAILITTLFIILANLRQV